MKKLVFFFLATAMSVQTSAAQTRKITVRVSNPIAVTRPCESIEIDSKTLQKRLKPEAGQTYRVEDATGNRLPVQMTHDGKLLFQAQLSPNGQATYTITTGSPLPYPTVACGQHYPDRADDIAWENDRVAFRAYGPALQKRGERAFGYDAFAKRVAYPVIYKWYDGELRRGISYHRDHGEGMDVYTVGPTLGCGTAALLGKNDSIVYPYCYQTFEILDNGPLRFTMKLTYRPFSLNGNSITEVRTISLDKGSQLNRTLISYNGLQHPMPVVTGIVVHPENPDAWKTDTQDGYIAYEDLTNQAKGNNGKIYVGAVVPYKLEKTGMTPFPEAERKRQRGGAVGHVLAQSMYQPQTGYLYYWGTGWSKYGFSSMEAWTTYLKNYASCLRHPVKISIQ